MHTTNSRAKFLSRRQFLHTSGLAASGVLVAGRTLAQSFKARDSGPETLRQLDAATEKLNIAIIGCGGRGAADLGEVKSENIVALCDVNENNLEAAAKKYPQAKKYVDFRKLYDNSKDFDAVVVAIAEHT